METTDKRELSRGVPSRHPWRRKAPWLWVPLLASLPLLTFGKVKESFVVVNLLDEASSTFETATASADGKSVASWRLELRGDGEALIGLSAEGEGFGGKGRCLKLINTSSPSDEWKAIAKVALNYDKDASNVVRFYARAAKTTDYDFDVRISPRFTDGQWNGSWEGSNTSITNDWQCFELVPSAKDNIVQFQFNFGKDCSIIYIDNIEIGPKQRANGLSGDDSDFEGGTRGNWQASEGINLLMNSADEHAYNGSEHCLKLSLKPGYTSGYIYLDVPELRSLQKYDYDFYVRSSKNTGTQTVRSFYQSTRANQYEWWPSPSQVVPTDTWQHVEKLNMQEYFYWQENATADLKYAPCYNRFVIKVTGAAGDVVFVDNVRMMQPAYKTLPDPAVPVTPDDTETDGGNKDGDSTEAGNKDGDGNSDNEGTSSDTGNHPTSGDHWPKPPARPGTGTQSGTGTDTEDGTPSGSETTPGTGTENNPGGGSGQQSGGSLALGAIEAAAQATAVEYYDLQGQRLAARPHGLCIERSGGRAKVVIYK